MHVGLPFMKLSLSPSTQKHNGKKAGTCSVKAAWDEMRDVRRGRDETIDRSMTDQNVWLCGSTEMDLEAEIQKYIDQVNADKKAHGKRILRCDAVTGIEMIEKPPMEYMENLPREEQIRFLRDSADVMDGILKEWNPNWITVAQVFHFDEFGGKAPHSHRIVVPISKDKDGILSFNAKAEFNLKFFMFVNTEYPRRMRALGHEVEDCKIFDRMTEEEKERHRLNRPEYGLESFEYKRRKQRELDEKIADREAILQQQDQILSEKAGAIARLEEIKADGEEQLQKLELAISEKGAKLDVIESRHEELAEKNAVLEAQNEKLHIRIMTQDEVDAMPIPPKTLSGDYKVPPKKYRHLLATAKRVGLIPSWEASLKDREQRLQEREEALEQRRRLPIPEKFELSSLRKMKTIVAKIAAMLPEGWLREALFAAVDGRDLIAEWERKKTRSRQIGEITRSN